MSEVLLEILERLDWTRSEISTVESDLEAWAKADFEISVSPHRLPGFRAINVEVKSSLPIGIRARSGTVANEIRSCLDSLASALAARNSVLSGAYFPVAHTESEFRTDKRFRKRLEKFSPADRAALLSWRPFAVGDDGEAGNILIYGLHHADVKRKHHRLGGKVGTPAFGIAVRGDCRIGELTGEAKCFKIPGKTRLVRLSADSYGSFVFEPIFSYAEPDVLRGRPLVETLNDFADVAEAIVRSFL